MQVTAYHFHWQRSVKVAAMFLKIMVFDYHGETCFFPPVLLKSETAFLPGC